MAGRKLGFKTWNKCLTCRSSEFQWHWQMIGSVAKTVWPRDLSAVSCDAVLLDWCAHRKMWAVGSGSWCLDGMFSQSPSSPCSSVPTLATSFQQHLLSSFLLTSLPLVFHSCLVRRKQDGTRRCKSCILLQLFEFIICLFSSSSNRRREDVALLLHRESRDNDRKEHRVDLRYLYWSVNVSLVECALCLLALTIAVGIMKN